MSHYCPDRARTIPMDKDNCSLCATLREAFICSDDLCACGHNRGMHEPSNHYSGDTSCAQCTCSRFVNPAAVALGRDTAIRDSAWEIMSRLGVSYDSFDIVCDCLKHFADRLESSINPAFILGRLGGLAGKGKKASEKKAAAVRENGKKGGRPKKATPSSSEASS